MDPRLLEQYLHEHIPLSRAMDVSVDVIARDRVDLSAPLGPNINHRETVFGGSASALAILSAWTLIHVRLRDQGLNSRVVIQENCMRYLKPVAARFVARASLPASSDWERFVAALERKKRSRIGVRAVLCCGGETVGEFDGRFVALAAGASL